MKIQDLLLSGTTVTIINTFDHSIDTGIIATNPRTKTHYERTKYGIRYWVHIDGTPVNVLISVYAFEL